ncbi:phage tail tape measure protein [Pseudomonas sp. Marseille-Q5115]|uniref:phage tail tape measure protein n=1 Tax=Pseudomonas sp. Marseille-Q5115 TaxID=2866593 RepID=UPI001CE41B39|nr:phage tail tape measure protein [Pseudomonas sp. Marseille-Q5115]
MLKPLKQVASGSTDTARALKAARDELKALQRTQADVNSFAALKQGSLQTAQALATAQQKASSYARSIARAGAPTREMVEGFNKAVAGSRALKERLDGQRTSLQQLRNKLQAAGISTRDLDAQNRRLREGIASANGAIDKQTAKLEANSRKKRQIAGIKARKDKLMGVAGPTAAMGATGAAYAYGIFNAAKAPLDEGKHYETEMNRTAALGLGEKSTQEAIKFAKDMKTFGTSQLTNLELMRDGLTIFADAHHAEMVAPTLSKMKFANEALFGSEAGEENTKKFMDMLKVVELRGGLKDEKAFHDQADMIQRIITATGGRVQGSEWLNVIKTGGVAAKGMGNEAFYYNLEPLVQEMGGHRVGTAMMSAYSNLYQGRTTKRAAGNLANLGLVDESRVKHDKVGQVSFLDVGALKGSEIFRRDQFEWMEKVLLPQLAKKGITSDDKIIDAIGSIFSNRTGSNLFAQMYLQRAQIHKNAALNAGADGIDSLNSKAMGTASGKELEMQAKLHDAYLEMSVVLMPLYSAALVKITEVIKGVVQWVQNNRQTAEWIAKIVIAVGLLAGVFGGLALVMASLIGPFAVLQYGLALFGVAIGPVGLAIAALVAGLVAGVVLIIMNWDKVKGFFLGLWAEITQGFSGGIAGIMATIANFSPLGLFYRAFAGVMSWFGVDLPTRFSEFGGMILDGLITGITSRLGKVKDAIVDVGDATIAWFKEKLDIHSPSRVFAQLGGYTMAGLAVGLSAASSQPLAAMQAMSNGLIQVGTNGITAGAQGISVDSRPPVSAISMAAYAPAGGNTYEINIHPPAGLDERAIARLVSAEIDRRDRARSVRGRSGLYDNDHG